MCDRVSMWKWPIQSAVVTMSCLGVSVDDVACDR